MTNSTLRQRFGLKSKDISSVSRIIRDAIDSNMVKALDPTQHQDT